MITDKRFFSLASLTLAGMLLLASCGEDTGAAPQEAAPDEAPEDSQEESTEEFNQADVMFAQMMIPHHEQAIEMAELAEDRAGPEVGALAEEIEAAQGPEIEQMEGMLESWGHPPMDGMDGMDHGDMGHGGMDGMLSEEQMSELEEAEGEAFDVLFLEGMIEHHEGAVDMAEDVLEAGASPEAQELAQEIVAVQEEEIEQMNEMLAELGHGTE